MRGGEGRGRIPEYKGMLGGILIRFVQRGWWLLDDWKVDVIFSGAFLPQELLLVGFGAGVRRTRGIRVCW